MLWFSGISPLVTIFLHHLNLILSLVESVTDEIFPPYSLLLISLSTVPCQLCASVQQHEQERDQTVGARRHT